MSFEIKVTPDFQRHAKRLVKKYASLKSELEGLAGQLRKNPTIGVSLGANAYKIRLSVKKAVEFELSLSLCF
jgi:mRNA-degrading endonuclease RelE of RelBE toxin-antitoxin system